MANIKYDAELHEQAVGLFRNSMQCCLLYVFPSKCVSLLAHSFETRDCNFSFFSATANFGQNISSLFGPFDLGPFWPDPAFHWSGSGLVLLLQPLVSLGMGTK